MRFWPRSLQGQLLLAIALALLVAQGVSAALIYRAQAERREAALVSAAAFRLTGGASRDGPGPRGGLGRGEQRDGDGEEQLPLKTPRPEPHHPGTRRTSAANM